jgi:peptide/nickel transport system permease protein
MNEQHAKLTPESIAAPSPRQGRSMFRSPQVLLSLATLALFVLTAIFAAKIAPADPADMNAGNSHLQPIWMRKDASIEGFWLGSDRYGRDIFSRLVYGARTGIFLALTAPALAALLGTVIGVWAGYAGGRVENILMRLTDIFSTFPAILFAMLMVLILREQPVGQAMNGLLTLTIAFAAIGWVGLARILRPVVRQIKQQAFVEAAYALGGTHWQIVLWHILPNVQNLIAVWIVSAVPVVILLEAGLGYIGVEIVQAVEGNEFRVSSWGGIFFDGRSLMHSNPYMLLAPTLCVLLISLSFSSLANYLKKRFHTGQNIVV